MTFSSEFWAALQTVIFQSGNQLKFPITESSKPSVKIKKPKNTKQTDNKLLLSKIKCWSSHCWNQNKPFLGRRIELRQKFFGLCFKTLLCLFKIIPQTLDSTLLYTKCFRTSLRRNIQTGFNISFFTNVGSILVKKLLGI